MILDGGVKELGGIGDLIEGRPKVWLFPSLDEAGWTVTIEGSQEGPALFPDRESALNHAVPIARREGAVLVIMDNEGRIAESHLLFRDDEDGDDGDLGTPVPLPR